MILQRISGSCEGEDAEGMEDGLGAAHREERDPLGCDGSARDSARVSAKARTCRGYRRESLVN